MSFVHSFTRWRIGLPIIENKSETGVFLLRPSREKSCTRYRNKDRKRAKH